MNRVMKFRAWDTQVQEMVYDVGIKGEFVCWKNSMDDIIWRHKSVWVPMQFTNLFDKNGTPIYEGDIVRHFNTNHVVEYQLGGFGYIPSRLSCFVYYGHNYHFDWKDNKSDKIEVIGNIYETPELLKE